MDRAKPVCVIWLVRTRSGDYWLYTGDNRPERVAYDGGGVDWPGGRKHLCIADDDRLFFGLPRLTVDDEPHRVVLFTPTDGISEHLEEIWADGNRRGYMVAMDGCVSALEKLVTHIQETCNPR